MGKGGIGEETKHWQSQQLACFSYNDNMGCISIVRGQMTPMSPCLKRILNLLYSNTCTCNNLLYSNTYNLYLKPVIQ